MKTVYVLYRDSDRHIEGAFTNYAEARMAGDFLEELNLGETHLVKTVDIFLTLEQFKREIFY